MRGTSPFHASFGFPNLSCVLFGVAFLLSVGAVVGWMGLFVLVLLQAMLLRPAYVVRDPRRRHAGSPVQGLRVPHHRRQRRPGFPDEAGCAVVAPCAPSAEEGCGPDEALSDIGIAPPSHAPPTYPLPGKTTGTRSAASGDGEGYG